ncbi:bleomycin hydrolase [Drosophila obscura]|uniref:bleomycin hydrolase n=1 Tax=Drosophila obscura TaxID=7282 RepID=UPI001BB20DBF|nr:bleomycin hydrolase [Drosophila obscura]
MSFPLTSEQLAAWRTQFYSEPRNLLAQNVCTMHDPFKVCLCSTSEVGLLAPNKHKVTLQGKLTSGGPAWITTGLNLLRLEFSKSFPTLPADFEFSAGHLVYWHKVERCNYLLHAVAEHLTRCEPVDGRKFRYLMKHVVPDGGNWQMFVNLVKKYGVMPKQCYQTTGRVRQLNAILRSKLREFASVLHNRFIFDGDGSALPALIVEEMMPQLYKVINIVLGEPPQEFSWMFNDSKKRYQCLEHLTGPSFYEVLLNKEPDLDAMVCLGHDPRLSSSYLSNYEVELSSNMVGGQRQRYNNQSMDVLVPIIVASLAGGRAVWLVHDVQTQVEREGLADLPLLFGLEAGKQLNKAERMIYKETRRNRVLLLTKVSLDAEQQPLEFRTSVPSDTCTLTASPPEARASLQSEEGIKARSQKAKASLCIKTDWLREYAFEIVVHSSFVPEDVLGAATRKECKELPPWDMMGGFLD